MGRNILIAVVFTALGAATAHAGAMLELYKRGYVELELNLVIGGEDADDDHVLYEPRALCVDSHGNMLVMDRKLFCVKTFDVAGDFLSEFGRKGEGPGEFFNPSTMAIDRQNHVVTYDLNKRSFQSFDAKGEHVLSRHYPSPIWKLAVLPDGNVIAYGYDWNTTDPEGPVLYRLLKFTSEFESPTVIDSLHIQQSIYIPIDNGTMMTSVPFCPSMQWEVMPDGDILVGLSTTYRIDKVSPTQERRVFISRTVAAPPVTRADKDEYFDRYADWEPRYLSKLRDAAKFPHRKPFFEAIIVDDEGNVLVKWIEDEDEVALYDVFDPSGEFVSRVKIDGLGRRAIIRDGVVYLRHTDPDELPTVRRYRMN